MPYADLATQREFQRRWMQRRREALVAQAGGKCVRCGYTQDLEFHHRDSCDKITHRFISWKPDRCKSEMDKCDLLCSDCHLEETRKQRAIRQPLQEHGTQQRYHTGCRCELCHHAKAEYEYHRRFGDRERKRDWRPVIKLRTYEAQPLVLDPVSIDRQLHQDQNVPIAA